jgi:hypothetical protein
MASGSSDSDSRVVPYCYKDKVVYTILTNDYQQSKQSAIDAFRSLDVQIDSKLTASQMNLYVLIGKNDGKKVYITEVGWAAVMSFLNEKRIVYLEEKKDINKTAAPVVPKETPKSWWKSLPWKQAISTVTGLSCFKDVEDDVKEKAKEELQSLDGDKGTTGNDPGPA